MDEEKIKYLFREEIGKPLNNIHNDLKKTETKPKPAHPIVYVAWIGILATFLYLMYTAYAITK